MATEPPDFTDEVTLRLVPRDGSDAKTIKDLAAVINEAQRQQRKIPNQRSRGKRESPQQFERVEQREAIQAAFDDIRGIAKASEAEARRLADLMKQQDATNHSEVDAALRLMAEQIAKLDRVGGSVRAEAK